MKTKKFLSMAALALVGALMTGCSSDDDILQPENKTNVVTLTATVGFDSGTGTRALTAAGVKTFADGDQMAVIYKNTSNETVKAVGTLTSGAGSASGTFTFTLTNPSKKGDVTYIYPAAMAGTTGVDYSKLNSQSSGTLTDLGSKYDLAMKIGTWKSGALPSLTLNNKLAILAINLNNSTGTSDITGDITDMTISDGTNTYTVSHSAAAGPIYVAIRPTSSATIYVTATDGTNEYGKTLSGKTYAANNGYNVTWNMSMMTTITWNSSNISDLNVMGTYYPYTKEGITLSANAEMNGAMWNDYPDDSMDGISFGANESGGFTFTAPTGKKFSKIEMTLTGSGGWSYASLGTGWAFAWSDPPTVTWTGTAATTVGLLTGASSFNGESVKSIVFTVY